MNESPTNPRFVTCPCQHCSGSIEFDASGLGQGETSNAECPYCHMETILFIQKQAETIAQSGFKTPPRVSLDEPLWFAKENSRVQLQLNSGQAIFVQEIQMFDAQEMELLSLVKARAQELFSGAKSDVGFIGGPLWVLGGMALQNFFLNHQSEKMAGQGMKLLEEIDFRERALRKFPSFFHVGQIQDVNHPDPQIWRVSTSTKPMKFIHSGSNFIAVKDTNGELQNIRWDMVETYRYFA